MAIKDLFDVDAPRRPQQENWLRMVSVIPGVKRAFDDRVTEEDKELADEARSLLSSVKGK